MNDEEPEDMAGCVKMTDTREVEVNLKIMLFAN